MKLKINLTKNILYYSFIISIFLHICFFTFGSILSKSKKESKFQRITFVTLTQEHKSTSAQEHKGIRAKEHKSIREEIKQEEIVQKPFSPYDVEKPTPEKVSGGGAEILTSISEEDAEVNGSQGSDFVVQNVPQGEGEGIGLGGDGSGIGIGGDDNGVGMGEPSYVPAKPEPTSEIDKSKILKEYLTKVVERIEKNKKYPEDARSENIEGRVVVKFVIFKNGKLKDIEVFSSSGYKILDEAAIRTVKRASPFLPIPDELEKENLSIKVNIVFKLEEKIR